MNLPALPDLHAARVMGHGPLDWGIVAVFAVVYLGMFLGGLPRLKLDRAGVALLGAIAMIAITGQTLEDAARTVDLPTVVLLFAFMVVSAQMRLSGFYAAVTRRVGAMPLSRNGLMAALIAMAGALLLSRRLHSAHVMAFVDWPLHCWWSSCSPTGRAVWPRWSAPA